MHGGEQNTVHRTVVHTVILLDTTGRFCTVQILVPVIDLCICPSRYDALASVQSASLRFTGQYQFVQYSTVYGTVRR
jgi:hypothetical protein